MSSNLMLIPACITVSKAFFKSTKHANNHPSFELQYVLIRQLITNIWSAVLAFFVKPICDLCIILWSWRNLSNLKLRTLLLYQLHQLWLFACNYLDPLDHCLYVLLLSIHLPKNLDKFLMKGRNQKIFVNFSIKKFGYV